MIEGLCRSHLRGSIALALIPVVCVAAGAAARSRRRQPSVVFSSTHPRTPAVGRRVRAQRPTPRGHVIVHGPPRSRVGTSQPAVRTRACATWARRPSSARRSRSASWARNAAAGSRSPRPASRNNRVVWVDARAGGLRYERTRLELDVGLSARTLTVTRDSARPAPAPALGVGRAGSPTPTGRFAVTEQAERRRVQASRTAVASSRSPQSSRTFLPAGAAATALPSTARFRPAISAARSPPAVCAARRRPALPDARSSARHPGRHSTVSTDSRPRNAPMRSTSSASAVRSPLSSDRVGLRRDSTCFAFFFRSQSPAADAASISRKRTPAGPSYFPRP